MDTKQTDIRIEGFGTIGPGDYGRVKIEGVGKIRGDVSFTSMVVEGTCSGGRNLKGDYLDIQGILKNDGDIKVNTLDIQGVLKSGDNKIYANKIVVEGILKNSGEVNADFVTIEGCANINDLFGDVIKINYGYGMLGFFSFGRGLAQKMNKANNIECSTLTACNITCHSICATDIVLSDHCKVDTITCNGTLKYDSTCRIGHIEGECNRKNS